MAGEMHLFSAGDKLPKSTGEDDSTLEGKLFFRPYWGNGSTGGILYSAGEHSYTLLRNINTPGMLAEEYLYTPLGNIKTY